MCCVHNRMSSGEAEHENLETCAPRHPARAHHKPARHHASQTKCESLRPHKCACPSRVYLRARPFRAQDDQFQGSRVTNRVQLLQPMIETWTQQQPDLHVVVNYAFPARVNASATSLSPRVAASAAPKMRADD